MLTFQEYLSVWRRWYKCAAMEFSQENLHLSIIISSLSTDTPIPKDSMPALQFYAERFDRRYSPFCPGTAGYKLTEGRWA
jgi:hypothetical protein